MDPNPTPSWPEIDRKCVNCQFEEEERADWEASEVLRKEQLKENKLAIKLEEEREEEKPKAATARIVPVFSYQGKTCDPTKDPKSLRFIPTPRKKSHSELAYSKIKINNKHLALKEAEHQLSILKKQEQPARRDGPDVWLSIEKEHVAGVDDMGNEALDQWETVDFKDEDEYVM